MKKNIAYIFWRRHFLKEAVQSIFCLKKLGKKSPLLLLVLCVFFTQTAVAENCLIQDEPAPSLVKYMETTDAMLSKISSKLQTSTQSQDSNAVVNKGTNAVKEVTSRLIGAYNSVFSFRNYFANIELQTGLRQEIEIPKEVERDLKLLKNTGEKIRKTMEQVMRSENSQTLIKDFCADFSDIQCSIDAEITAEDLIKVVNTNYKNVESNFINTILTRGSALVPVNFVETSFAWELQKYYTPASFSQCSAEEWGFLYEVEEKTESISSKNKTMESGFQEWKNAWNLLMGSDISESTMRETEKKLLREELSRQGVWGDNQTIILDNLEKYNNYNYLGNTFNSTKTNIDNELSEFKQEVLEDFINDIAKTDEDGNTVIDTSSPITLKDIQTGKENSATSQEIKGKVTTLYNNLLPYTAESEADTKKMHARIIQIHIELNDSINVLRNSCKKSVKICNQQDYGNGNCGKCQ